MSANLIKNLKPSQGVYYFDVLKINIEAVKTREKPAELTNDWTRRFVRNYTLNNSHRSPTEMPFTSVPISLTTPANSCPKITHLADGNSPASMWRSVPHIPENATLTRTSFGDETWGIGVLIKESCPSQSCTAVFILWSVVISNPWAYTKKKDTIQRVDWELGRQPIPSSHSHK